MRFIFDFQSSRHRLLLGNFSLKYSNSACVPRSRIGRRIIRSMFPSTFSARSGTSPSSAGKFGRSLFVRSNSSS
jgi:hypothetical protein